MVHSEGQRSTAQARRLQVLHAATAVFARSGYYATTVEDVAEATGISQAYVMRLFGSKLGHFVSVIDQCNERVATALASAAVSGGMPGDVLEAMYKACASSEESRREGDKPHRLAEKCGPIHRATEAVVDAGVAGPLAHVHPSSSVFTSTVVSVAGDGARGEVAARIVS